MLVVLHVAGASAVDEAARLARHVQGVASWMSVEEWQASATAKQLAAPGSSVVRGVPVVLQQQNSSGPRAGADTPTQTGDSCGSEGSSSGGDCDTFLSPTPPSADTTCEVENNNAVQNSSSGGGEVSARAWLKKHEQLLLRICPEMSSSWMVAACGAGALVALLLASSKTKPRLRLQV